MQAIAGCLRKWDHLIIPSLVSSNVIRFLELTAIQKSLPFSDIGKDFERIIRKNGKEILEKHPYRSSAHVLPTRRFRTSNGEEEIDLALGIGETLYAIEVKYDHFPTEPYEIYNFIRGAQTACDQASRKAKFLSANLEALKQSRLIEARITSVVGIALNNTMLLSGVCLSGIPIIDQDILGSYLRNTEEETLIVNKTVIFGVNRENPYYNSRENFERSAQNYFFSAPQPKKYEAMLSKVKFRRRGGPIRGKGYDLAVYDLSDAASPFNA